MATAENLADPLWRLANLYSCKGEGEGRAVPFRPRPEQDVLYQHLEHSPHVPVYVIKSRRLGISTAIDTYMVDKATFTAGYTGQIIDQKQEDATKKMVNIVRFARNSLPEEIRARYHVEKENDSELRTRLITQGTEKESVIYATTGARGGDCSMLHVSEWGPIAATDPVRSREIRTGAFPAARKGRRVVETTWYGGKGGDLWELVKPILDKNANAEGVVYFFPWHSDPASIKIEGHVTRDLEEYFRVLADRLSKHFSTEQKYWYASKSLEQGMFVKREYPSTLDEALSVPMPGTIYGDLVDQLRSDNRVQNFPPNREVPAYTFWDIGMSDFGCIWLVQFVGLDILLLDYVSRTGENAQFYANHCKDWEEKYRIKIFGHYLPHDAAQRSKGTGKTYLDDLKDAGVERARIVPRIDDIWLGINQCRGLLPRCYIHSEACALSYEDGSGITIPSGLECLEFYHRKVEVGANGQIREEPVHDKYGHGCDALRTLSEAYSNKMLDGTSKIATAGRVPAKVLRGPGPDSYPWERGIDKGPRVLR